jgi:hypothetical protein
MMPSDIEKNNKKTGCAVLRTNRTPSDISELKKLGRLAVYNLPKRQKYNQQSKTTFMRISANPIPPSIILLGYILL